VKVESAATGGKLFPSEHRIDAFFRLSEGKWKRLRRDVLAMAHRIDETDTKLRTGSKAPSLYRRFSQYGVPCSTLQGVGRNCRVGRTQTGRLEHCRRCAARCLSTARPWQLFEVN
jgi:hypothetical protein